MSNKTYNIIDDTLSASVFNITIVSYNEKIERKLKNEKLFSIEQQFKNA